MPGNELVIDLAVALLAYIHWRERPFGHILFLSPVCGVHPHASLRLSAWEAFRVSSQVDLSTNQTPIRVATVMPKEIRGCGVAATGCEWRAHYRESIREVSR